MTHIIAGRFQLQEQVQDAITNLQNAGFPAQQIVSFYVNSAGQHDAHSRVEVVDETAGVVDGRAGVLIGTGVGGTAGAVVGTVGGQLGMALGALVGAHVGNLISSLANIEESNSSGEGGEDAPVQRKSGMVVAVGLSEVNQTEQVVHIMRLLGADQLEAAQGVIADGRWQDFDPLAAPSLLPEEVELPLSMA